MGAAIRYGSLKTACHILPIDKIVEEVCQIVRPLVAEIDIVGMFPHITAKQRFLAKTEWVHPIFSFGNGEPAITIFY